MGNDYNYCSCKCQESQSEAKFVHEDNSFISGSTNYQNNSAAHKRDFSFSLKPKAKVNLDQVKRNAAANKIIKNYRIFKIKQQADQVNNNDMEQKNLQNDGSKNTSAKKNSLETSNNFDSLAEPGSKLKQTRTMNNSIVSYQGGRKDGAKEGFGIQTWQGGAKYTGFWKNDKAEGIGIFLASGDKYEGEFSQDGACGYGLYTHSNGAIYEGYWIDDAQETIGIETWKDNSIYMGEYYKGKKHGIGTYIWPDKSKYEGEWYDNTLKGYGIYYFTNNRVYLGQWKNNMKDGFGEFIWSDKRYLGSYSKDKKEGFGIYYWEKLNKAFMGFWKGGKQDGFGKYMTKSKMKYGIWGEENKIKWLDDEDQAMKLLDDKGLTNYKKLFSFTLDDINNYFINHDDYYKIVEEGIK